MKNVFEIASAVQSGKMTAREAVLYSLQKIKELNPQINAFVEVWPEEALKRADEIDARREKGEKLGLLAGVPVGIKDNILYKGHKATCCSKMLENYVAPYNSTVVEKLLAADAVIVGRTNMDEFAMGSSNQTAVWWALSPATGAFPAMAWWRFLPARTRWACWRRTCKVRPCCWKPSADAT